MERDDPPVGPLDMSIATERRQFYDSEIRVAARPRYAHVERRYWLAICRVNDEAISYLCAQPHCAQFKASLPAAKDTVANKSAEVDHSAQCTRSAPTAPDAREPLTR